MVRSSIRDGNHESAPNQPKRYRRPHDQHDLQRGLQKVVQQRNQSGERDRSSEAISRDIEKSSPNHA